METLIIYDNKGTIYYAVSGSVQEPVGLPFMRVTVPEGKRVASVDVTAEPHAPIFEDLPKSEIDQIKEQLQLTQQAIDEILLGGGM